MAAPIDIPASTFGERGPADPVLDRETLVERGRGLAVVEIRRHHLVARRAQAFGGGQFHRRNPSTEWNNAMEVILGLFQISR